MISTLIYILIYLLVLGLVYYLGRLLIGLLPDAQAQQVIGVIWLVICVLIAIGILLDAVGVVAIGPPPHPLIR